MTLNNELNLHWRLSNEGSTHYGCTKGVTGQQIELTLCVLWGLTSSLQAGLLSFFHTWVAGQVASAT